MRTPPAARWLAPALFALSGCATSSPAPTPATPAQAVREAPSVTTPQLVISVVIDQLGSDTLQELEPLLASDGALRRALAHGQVYDRVVYPYAATLTAPGHAAIYSGAVPAESGIAANALLDTQTGRLRSTVDDGKSAVLGVPGEFAAPTSLRVPTVADVLDRETEGRSKIISIALKDRSAVLPAGQNPDLVLFYEPRLRGFTTSSYYMPALPAWLVDYQQRHPIDLAASWELPDTALLAAHLGPDAAPGEDAHGGLGTAFPHRLGATRVPEAMWSLMPQATDYVIDLALHAAEQIELCRDDVPDLLAISISGTDYVGHAYGPSSWEYADALRHADRAVARLVAALETRCRVAVLVTSDHGVVPLAEHAGTARVYTRELVGAVEQALDAQLGAGDWVASYDPPYVTLAPSARRYANRAKLMRALLAALRAQPGVREAFDARDPALLRARKDDPIAASVLLSLHPDTSGDVFVVLAEGAVPDPGPHPGSGTTHGSPYAYDSHVPVLAWGPGISQGRHTEPLDQRRVASTLAAWLGVVPPLPNALPPLPDSQPAPR